MSWGTTYILYDYLNRCSMRDIDDIERDEDTVKYCWNKLLALAAMSPRDVRSEEGGRIDWADYVLSEIKTLREDLEEAMKGIQCKTLLRQVRDQGKLHVRICANGHASMYDPDSKYTSDKCEKCGAEFVSKGTMESYREG